MSLLGFNALGRDALGQITSLVSRQVNPTQAVGIGVAGTIIAGPAKPLTGVTGTGVAGTLSPADSSGLTGVSGTGVAHGITASVTTFLVGVAGTGQAGSLSGADSTGLVGVSGTGVAHSITPSVFAFITQAVGIGVAGSLSGPHVVPDRPFSGYDGLVSGRYALGQISTQYVTDGGIAISVVVAQAAGIGVAGSLAISEITGLVGVAGGGVAGAITPTVSPATLQGVSGTGVAGQITIVISGGGTSSAAPGAHRKKPKIRKPPPEPEAQAPAPLPLPPFKGAPALVPSDAPDLVDPRLIPGGLLELQDQIQTAQDEADIERFLRGLDQDEQDAADIADVLALLD